MVIPMRRYSFFVYHKDYDQFLEKVRDLSVVHLVEREDEQVNESGDALTKNIDSIKKTLKYLSNRDVEVSKKQLDLDCLLEVDKINSLRYDFDKAHQKIDAIEKDMELLEPWGNFSFDLIDKLEESGVRVGFFRVAAKHFDASWSKENSIEIVQDNGKNIYFMGIFRDGEEGNPFTDAELIRLPEQNLAELTTQKDSTTNEMNKIAATLDEKAKTITVAFETEIISLEQKLDFINASMTGSYQVDDKLIIVDGWIRKDKEKVLQSYLDESGTVYLTRKPVPGENVPVALKNNFFSRLFEPIGKMFSLPTYDEMDLTVFFAPFFMLFFGMCLGDAGYGLVIFLGTFIGRFFVKKELKPLMTLGTVLGFSTMIVGALTGTVFGVWLMDSGSQSIKDLIVIKSNGTLFYLALAIGLVQILMGMVLRAINKMRQFGFKYGLSSVGWFIMVSSLVLIMMKQAESVANITIFVGIGLILFFNDLKANIFARLGKGIWELYDITGFFGDVLSYVRLFALGISSAILGLVINSIGGQFLGIPILGPVLFVLFLVVGHLGNMLISGLGSFVHPMRLTFVEFYKNAGFTGGGKSFKPFTLKIKK